MKPKRSKRSTPKREDGWGEGRKRRRRPQRKSTRELIEQAAQEVAAS